MTNTTSRSAKHPASPSIPVRRDWTKPVLDILALANAEFNHGRVNDGLSQRKSN